MSKPLNILPLEPDPSTAVSRRVALQALLGGVGAGLARPATAEAQHPMHQHLLNPGAIEQAQQRAAATAYSAEFLDAHQSKTLEVLAEAIVPGSTAARVAPFLDQLLAVESAEHQRAFLGSLGAFDMAAINKHGKAWIALTAPEQDALLREASTADPKSPFAVHFQNVKDWVAGAYYSSEPGMRELGWTGNTFHRELPGCTHPGGHQD
jgi:Gluconate 2-dehydrogenase subunit 3